MAQIYKLFNINTLKNTIVIFEKHVRLFTASFDKEQERT